MENIGTFQFVEIIIHCFIINRTILAFKYLETKSGGKCPSNIVKSKLYDTFQLIYLCGFDCVLQYL